MSSLRCIFARGCTNLLRLGSNPLHVNDRECFNEYLLDCPTTFVIQKSTKLQEAT
jgi:hypothetical protein